MGLIRLPLDGQPNKWMGLIAHVGKINAMVCDSFSKRLLTAGQNDLNVNVWKINLNKLEKNPIFNQDNKEPLKMYPQMLEGGEKGAFYNDLKNFFYYSQIRRKEENATKAHKLDGKIPLKEIQNLIVALGFYPTLLEIKNIENEVISQKKGKNTNLKLEEFVKLFVNHRPVYGLTRQDIAEEFYKISEGSDFVDRNVFVKTLTKFGEVFSKDDLDLYLNALTGKESYNEVLKEHFEIDFLLNQVLGFENEED